MLPNQLSGRINVEVMSKHKQAALQLIAESSRRCEIGQGNFQHLTHTWMVKMVRKPWYITRKGIQGGGDKKKQKKERKVKEIQQ